MFIESEKSRKNFRIKKDLHSSIERNGIIPEKDTAVWFLLYKKHKAGSALKKSM